ncbi:MAG: DUF3347 domain-containing protein [Chitinophagaceae bacterium]
MKSIFFAALVMAFVFTACNSNTDKSKDTKTEKETTPTEQMYACSMHPEVTGKKGDKCSKCGMELSVPVDNTGTPIPPAGNNSDTTKPISTVTPSSFSIKGIISNYLKLKNALTKDDSKTAATAGEAIVANLATLDANSLPAAQKKAFTDVAGDAKEHSEHIGANSGKLDHQREHFAMLSKDVNDLIKTFGAGQKLYLDFCPMYDDGKGANWISETKEIKNPYYGSKMLTCGSVKKEL